MQAVCDRAEIKLREQCKSAMGMYSIGSSAFGCATYKESQREACECVPDKVASSAKHDDL